MINHERHTINRYDPAVLLTSAEFDISSNLYRIEASGALTWLQDMPTQVPQA